SRSSAAATSSDGSMHVTTPSEATEVEPRGPNPRDVSESTRPVAALHQGIYGSGRLPIVVPGASYAVISQPATQKSENRPWKLPEPWTPRTRPPLLGKPHRTRFPTATTGTHREPKVLPMFPVYFVTY